MDNERFCPTCGRANALTARYCSNCGQMLSARTVLLQKPAGTFSEEDTVRKVPPPPPPEPEAARPRVEARGTYRQQARPEGQGARRETAPRSAETRTMADPGVCAVLSFLVPGIGQILCGQVVKGIVLLIAAYVSVAYPRLLFGMPGFLLFVGKVFVAIDAYNIARRRRAGRRVGDWEWAFQEEPAGPQHRL